MNETYTFMKDKRFASLIQSISIFSFIKKQIQTHLQLMFNNLILEINKFFTDEDWVDLVCSDDRIDCAIAKLQANNISPWTIVAHPSCKKYCYARGIETDELLEEILAYYNKMTLQVPTYGEVTLTNISADDATTVAYETFDELDHYLGTIFVNTKTEELEPSLVKDKLDALRA